MSADEPVDFDPQNRLVKLEKTLLCEEENEEIPRSLLRNHPGRGWIHQGDDGRWHTLLGDLLSKKEYPTAENSNGVEAGLGPEPPRMAANRFNPTFKFPRTRK